MTLKQVPEQDRNTSELIMDISKHWFLW